VFDDQTFTRAQIFSYSNDGAIVTGTAQEGQTLTAETATNDTNAAISYQWEESNSTSFSSFTDIGSNSSTIRCKVPTSGITSVVVATATDSVTQQTATATSAATGEVQPEPPTISISSSVSVNEDGIPAVLPITVTPPKRATASTVMIGGIPTGDTLTDGGRRQLCRRLRPPR